MTVAELIATLQKMPQNARVYISGDQLWEVGGYEEVSEIYMECHDESDPDYLPDVWLG